MNGYLPCYRKYETPARRETQVHIAVPAAALPARRTRPGMMVTAEIRGALMAVIYPNGPRVPAPAPARAKAGHILA